MQNLGIDHEKVPRDILDHAVMDLRIVFALYQPKGKSTITLSQLKDIIALLGTEIQDVTYSELATMVGLNVDEATNMAALYEARIDFKDFVRFFVTQISGSHLKVTAKEIFRAMDCDDSGEITAEELEESLTSMGMTINSEEAIAMTSIADTSTDRLIEYAEFKYICKRIDEHMNEEKEKKKAEQEKKNSIKRQTSWMNKARSDFTNMRRASFMNRNANPGAPSAGPNSR